MKYCNVIPRVNGMEAGLTMNSVSDGINFRLSRQGNSIEIGILIDYVPLSIVKVFSLLTFISGPGK